MTDDWIVERLRGVGDQFHAAADAFEDDKVEEGAEHLSQGREGLLEMWEEVKEPDDPEYNTE